MRVSACEKAISACGKACYCVRGCVRVCSCVVYECVSSCLHVCMCPCVFLCVTVSVSISICARQAALLDIRAGCLKLHNDNPSLFAFNSRKALKTQ